MRLHNDRTASKLSKATAAPLRLSAVEKAPLFTVLLMHRHAQHDTEPSTPPERRNEGRTRQKKRDGCEEKTTRRERNAKKHEEMQRDLPEQKSAL
jgi:hypothetical protein